MSFGAAIRSCFSQYAGFSGRARRSEYWFFALFAFLVYLVAVVLDALMLGRIFTVLAVLGLLLPSLAVAVRRLHDTDRSGWWVLLGLIPFGGIALLVFVCLDSQPHPNRFGPCPKAAAGPGWMPYGQQPYPAPDGQQPYPAAPYGQQPYPAPYGQQPDAQPPQPPAPSGWS